MSATIAFNESDLSIQLEQRMLDIASTAASAQMDAAELSYLLASMLTAQLTADDLIVEIGAYVGSTTAMMHRALIAMGNSETPILSIDPFDRVNPDPYNPRGVYAEYLQNILKAGGGERCLPLVAFSHHAHRAVPGGIGFLIIDGDHHYESIWRDLILYADKVRPNGIIFVDDYHKELYPDVFRAYNEFLALRPDYESLHRAWFAIARRRATGAEHRPPALV